MAAGIPLWLYWQGEKKTGCPSETGISERNKGDSFQKRLLIHTQHFPTNSIKGPTHSDQKTSCWWGRLSSTIQWLTYLGGAMWKQELSPRETENLRPWDGPWVIDSIFGRMGFLWCGSWSNSKKPQPPGNCVNSSSVTTGWSQTVFKKHMPCPSA